MATPSEQLTARGYRRISRKYRTVSRIDRKNWKEYMARNQTPWDVAEGLRWVERLGLSGAEDFYLRCLSKDKITIATDYVFLAIPLAGQQPVGYVPKHQTEEKDMKKKVNIKPIDYTGCHPVIVEHLMRGEMIECDCRNYDGNMVRTFITGFDHAGSYPYLSGNAQYSRAEPLEITTETRVKKASEIVKWLEENEYHANSTGFFHPEGARPPSFTFSMFRRCGTADLTTFNWLPEWLEEVDK